MKTAKTMVCRVTEYVTFKRNLGYMLKGTDRELMRFAEYADGISHRGPITIALILGWAQMASENSRLYRARRVEIARTFTKYEAIFDPMTEIPPRGILGPAHQRIQPYIYTQNEINALIKAAKDLSPCGGLRPQTYATLIGLLACTGLRVCEALRLERDDFDLSESLIVVRETKFHKSRLVPVEKSAAQALCEYSRFRDRYHPVPTSNRFLLSERGRELLPSAMHYSFQKIRDAAGIAADPSQRCPRLYDLRHTFACRVILQWYREGADVNHHVPWLSTYLGHVKPSDTYWYLSSIPQLMNIAGQRFENACGQFPGVVK